MDEPCWQGSQSALSELSTRTTECYSRISHSHRLSEDYTHSRILKKLKQINKNIQAVKKKDQKFPTQSSRIEI